MEYQRLTEKDWHKCKFSKKYTPREARKRLWELENLIENKLICTEELTIKNVFFADLTIDGGEYYLELQKKDGKTPNDIIIELQKKLVTIRKEVAREIFEKIHEKEGYYPMASVGIGQNDMIDIAKEFGIKYTLDGVEVE